MKLVVIDGNSIVNRAFYGVRMLNAPDGTPTNAVFGFLNIYGRIMAEEAPDAVCVTFDLKAPTFRHLQYEGYKAQRKGMPEELAVQMPILKEVLDAMNIRRYELSGWEADDLIGSIAQKAAAAGWDTVAVTGDKDTLQLIEEHTFIRLVKTKGGQTSTVLYDEKVFSEEYGFSPRGIIDLKALMGDASDNIPGVAGVGEKTAMELIGRFGTIERIYSEIDTLDIKDSVRKKLIAGRDMANMSYDLATIRKDAPIEFNVSENAVKPVDNDRLWSIFTRLNFKKLIEAYGLIAPAEGKTAENECVEFEDVCESVEVLTAEDIAAMEAAFLGTIAGVSFSDDFSAAAAVPDGGNTAFIIYDTSPVYREAMELLCREETKKAGHNVKDIMRELMARGFSAEGWVFDSALAAYLLESTASDYSVESLTERWCGFAIMEGADNGQLSLLDEGVNELAAILSRGAAELCLMEKLVPEMKKEGLYELFSDIEMPLCKVLADMEKEGFLVDRKALSQFGESLTGEIESLTKAIWDLAGEEFNINSPKQLGDILFTKLMLPAPKKTKTGYSTNAEVLEKLRSKHPIIGLVLKFREISKLKSTYADGLTKVIGPDGRIHTNFQMTVTATGRLSSVEPNLQNIPVRRELGGEIRKMFVAAPGNILVDADYSQIELRILAHVSQDETMIKAFLEGEDIHTVTAAQVLGISPEEVTPQERRNAKAVNFGIVYGISAFSLSEDIGTSVQTAKDYINTYMEKYHGVRDYMENTAKTAKEEGVVKTLYGRRRPLPEIRSSNFAMRSFGERVARNMPIQGTAADIMKLAMIRVDKALRDAGLSGKIILQVHDELIVECPEGERVAVADIITREMENTANLRVPLTAEAHWGYNWYEAK